MSEISCEEVLHEVELYIDGELDPARTVQLADHLGSCSPCMQHATFQSRLKEIVRSKCRSTAPDYLATRIQIMIRTERLGDG